MQNRKALCLSLLDRSFAAVDLTDNSHIEFRLSAIGIKTVHFLLYIVQLMDSRSEVLFSFLEHTIKTDEALLLAMPKPDGDRAADCSDQRMPGDDAAERILKRRTELEARIQLSEKVLEVLKMEKQ